MTRTIQHPQLAELMKEEYTLSDIQTLLSFLEQQGTFEFPTLETGLFSAAITNDDKAHTGYQQVWVRDNIHIAHAHYVIGETETAYHCAIALMSYFKKHHDRSFSFTRDYQSTSVRNSSRFTKRYLSTR